MDHSTNASSLHSAYGMKETVACPTTCMDAYVDYCCGKKVVVKIDMEGAEESVFLGGQRFFREVRPWWVIVECFDPRHLDGMAEISYQMESLDTNGNALLTPPSGKCCAP